MKKQLMNSVKLLGCGVLTMTFAHLSMADAVYTSGVTGNWEVSGNWTGATGATGIPGSADTVIINGTDTNVTFDGSSWQYLVDNSLLTSGTTGEYRYNLYRQGTGAGTNTVTFDYGNANTMRTTNSSAQLVGSSSGSNNTLNHVSGNTIFETNTFHIGEKSGSTGSLNITGGTLTIQRESAGNSLNVGVAGTGGLQISGGSFLTRAGATIGENGTFSVQGSGVTEIGIGGSGSVDGRWIQSSGGLLDIGVDAGGLTKILVHDEGGSGTSATFESGSLLGVEYLSGFSGLGTWTVLEVEGGTITDNGLAFAGGVDTGIWSFNIDNSGANGILTVTAIPEPGTFAMLAGCVALAWIVVRRRS